MADQLWVKPEDVAVYLDLDLDSALPKLTLLCRAVQRRVEDHCERKFLRGNYTEYHDIASSGVYSVWVKNPPIVTLTSLTDDAQVGARAITVADDVQTYNGPNYGEARLWNTEGTFVAGVQAVKIVYTGGYAADDIPEDLALAAWQMVAVLWEGAEPLARASQAIDGENISWRDDSIPPQAKPIIDKYKRLWVPGKVAR